MINNFDELKIYVACCGCQYYIDNKCNNKGECIWLTIEKNLKAFEFIKPYINVYAPNKSVDRDKYMLCVGHDAYEIPKEIYDLFRKIL